jgi:hypothetical protein
MNNVLRYIPIKELKPAEYNPRTMSRVEFDGLLASIEQFGVVDPLVVNKDMTIIGGHQRYRAAKKLKIKEVPCLEVDVDKHTEIKLNVLLNSQAISGNFDKVKLAALLDQLKLDDDYEALRLRDVEPVNLSEVNQGEWDGMPEYNQDNQMPFKQVIVSFNNEAALEDFAELMGQKIVMTTKSVWYPASDKVKVSDQAYE